MADNSVEAGCPAVILVAPQLGENIGTAARAMANFGLVDLRLVNPRDGWPSDKARAAASRADHVIDAARVFESVADAVADLAFIYATTARVREVAKPVVGPREAAARLRALVGQVHGGPGPGEDPGHVEDADAPHGRPPLSRERGRTAP